MNDKQILLKAINTFGKEKQMDMVLGECSELMTELIIYARHEKENMTDLISEIADVYIMIDQYEIIIGITDLTPAAEVEKGYNVIQDTILSLLALQKEVCKRKRGKSHTIESIARMTDVLLMLEFVKDMLRETEHVDVDKLIEDEREFKIKRLEGRIEEWNAQNVK